LFLSHDFLYIVLNVHKNNVFIHVFTKYTIALLCRIKL